MENDERKEEDIDRVLLRTPKTHSEWLNGPPAPCRLHLDPPHPRPVLLINGNPREEPHYTLLTVDQLKTPAPPRQTFSLWSKCLVLLTCLPDWHENRTVQFHSETSFIVSIRSAHPAGVGVWGHTWVTHLNFTQLKQLEPKLTPEEHQSGPSVFSTLKKYHHDNFLLNQLYPSNHEKS